ncbi:MAG: DUF1573 domain-containing protein [candidate division Zixibacteria bacterium]|nr:DUF1573 domain-containing protein [candidate division Zixibacteria bacterium]
MKFSGTILTVLVISALAVGGAVAQPKLEIPDNGFEFGYIPQNSSLKHYYWFKSVGSDTLVINEIKTGCSCVLVPLDSKVIAPGDSMRVGISWNVGRRLGRIGRYPYIFTNAGGDPLQVLLEGNAVQTTNELHPVAFSPFKFEVSAVGENLNDEMRFKVKNDSDARISITRISPAPVECEVELPESVGGNSEATGAVKVRPEFIDKEFECSITVELDDKEKTRITVPIRRKLY